jgi:PTH1 family peptidyl-tRNA hydrolase
MYIVVGLGNPGDNYQKTRHNLGFLVLDNLGSDWQEKFDALICKTSISGNDVVLVKPQTFMNLSGKAVNQVMSFYKANDLIVVHDEMDIDTGLIKISKQKNSGGHKGVQSIIDLIGTNDFIRIRIGIGRPNNIVENHVLGKPTQEEQTLIDKGVESATDALKEIIQNGYDIAANKYN